MGFGCITAEARGDLCGSLASTPCEVGICKVGSCSLASAGMVRGVACGSFVNIGGARACCSLASCRAGSDTTRLGKKSSHAARPPSKAETMPASSSTLSSRAMRSGEMLPDQKRIAKATSFA